MISSGYNTYGHPAPEALERLAAHGYTVVRTDTAGLYFKIPFVQQVQKVDMTTHGFGIGYQVEGGGQNIAIDSDAQMITSDFNLINIDFYLEYKVSDPIAYLFNTNNPEMILANEALSCIRATVTDYPVDEVMTTGKGQIQHGKERMQRIVPVRPERPLIQNIHVRPPITGSSPISRPFSIVRIRSVCSAMS